MIQGNVHGGIERLNYRSTQLPKNEEVKTKKEKKKGQAGINFNVCRETSELVTSLRPTQEQQLTTIVTGAGNRLWNASGSPLA
jgi:hypothetical protein